MNTVRNLLPHQRRLGVQGGRSYAFDGCVRLVRAVNPAAIRVARVGKDQSG